MQNFLEFTWYCDICYLSYILPHVVASWFPRGSDSEDLPAMQETQVQSLGQEDHLEKGMTTHSVFSPGELHGQRSLVGYSPWGRKSCTQLTNTFTFTVLQSERYQSILETMKSSIWDSWLRVNCLWLLLLSNIYSTCSEVKEFTDVGSISTSVQFSRSVISNSLRPHGLQHTRLPCPSPAPGTYLNSCPSSQWCHPTISSSVVSFSSHLQSFPAPWSFPMSKFVISGGQSIEVSASASVFPMNIQDWFPSG